MASSMLATFLAVVPIFALVFAGFLAGRLGVLSVNASTGLNAFVVWLALPALLFQTVAKAHWSDLWLPGFIAAFGLSGLLTLLGTVLVALRRGRRGLADAALDGLNASYPNVGFMGFPIAATLLGPAALMPTTIAAIMTMCVFFAAAITLIELSLHKGTGLWSVLVKVSGSIVRHPLIIAPACAAPLAFASVAVPGPVDQFLSLLAAAAAPSALVSIGLFLVKQGASASTAGNGPARLLVAAKLLVHPALAWVIADRMLGLPREIVCAVVLMAGLPTGTGSFMLADFYRRDREVSARVTVLSTLLSLLTISVGMALVM